MNWITGLVHIETDMEQVLDERHSSESGLLILSFYVSQGLAPEFLSLDQRFAPKHLDQKFAPEHLDQNWLV